MVKLGHLKAINFLWDMRKSIWSRCSNTYNRVVVVVALLFYVHGKHLRSYRDGQLT